MKDLFFKTIMLKGEAGGTIASIEKTSSELNVDTYTITLNDGETSTFEVTNGTSIASIAKTSTSGLVDTYTITLTDGSTTTFDVTNGEDAAYYEVPSGSVLYFDSSDPTPQGYEATVDPNGQAIANLQNAYKDNNLIYGGILYGLGKEPSLWSTHNYGVTNGYGFSVGNGYYVMSGNYISIDSPRFSPFETLSGENIAFSVSVMYEVGGVVKTASQEGIIRSVAPETDIVNEDGIVIGVNHLTTDLSLYVKNDNPDDETVYIKAIKLERGSTATPIEKCTRDIGVNVAVEALETETKRLDSAKGTVAANTDLDTIKDCGNYWLNSTYTNLPHAGNAAGLLEVLVPVLSASYSVVIQRYTRYDANYAVINVFERVFNSSSWGAWKTVLTVS